MKNILAIALSFCVWNVLASEPRLGPSPHPRGYLANPSGEPHPEQYDREMRARRDQAFKQWFYEFFAQSNYSLDHCGWSESGAHGEAVLDICTAWRNGKPYLLVRPANEKIRVYLMTNQYVRRTFTGRQIESYTLAEKRGNQIVFDMDVPSYLKVTWKYGPTVQGNIGSRKFSAWLKVGG